MHFGTIRPRLPYTPIRAAAGALLAYGSLLIFLQTEAPLKLVRAAMGYAGWVWGGFSDIPTMWAAPTDLDGAARTLLSALTLHQPLLPWLTWSLGAALLLAASYTRNEKAAPHPQSAPRENQPLVWAGIAGLVLAVAAGCWLRAANLLPNHGHLTGSNFDEMVYYTQAELLVRGALPYRDTFMAHPPGVVYAFAPALALEKAWGGVAAFVAARQWLFLYSSIAVPLTWLAARRIGGSIAGTVAAIIVALDGKAAFAPQSDRLLPNVGVLETLVSAASLGALLLFLYAPGKKRPDLWVFLAGLLCGVALICKIPGLALTLALLVYTLAQKRHRHAALLAAGAALGAGAALVPFLLAASGQVVRQAVFFQLLRPHEVREGVDQAARIASYPEAQLTLLLAGLGIFAVTYTLWTARKSGEGYEWAIPALWAAPVITTFLLGRSFHSQYYTQWVPPLALVGSALASRALWSTQNAGRNLAVGLLTFMLLPLVASQWRVASMTALDKTFVPAEKALAADPGAPVMAFNPGFTFVAGLPPARVPLLDGHGDYLVDTAGYTVYLSEEIDRLPWGHLLGSVKNGARNRNEEELLVRPSAQAVLLAGAVDAETVVLDQKIGLPKLTAQSVKLLESRAASRREVGFATVLTMRKQTSRPAAPFPLSLVGATLSRPEDLLPVQGNGTLSVDGTGVVQLALYWRPEGYLAQNLHVVVRLVDKGGQTAFQLDTEPAEGLEQTSRWRPGFTYPDIRNIPLQSVPQGEYNILVTLYDPAGNTGTEDAILLPKILRR